MGHLRGVEEVARVPVGERGRGVQLQPRAVGVALVAVETVEQAQRLDPVQDTAAGGEQAKAVGDFIFGGRRAQESGRLPLQVFVPFLQQRISVHLDLQTLEIGGAGEQARVFLLERTENFLSGRNRDARRFLGGG